ncbi:uncharacterized protein LOC132936038 isoform X2 [Metopolophium dirhodum]|nr:uncharacterized protein LOC132936038 isoform X2 [Metopolophium dirhodum]
MAEHTTDLSTSEDIQNKTRRRKLVVEDAPIFTGLSNTDVILSSSVCDLTKSNTSHKISQKMSLTSPNLEVRKKLFDTTSSTSSQNDFLIASFNNKQKYDTQHLSSTVSGINAANCNESYDYRTYIDVPTRNHDDFDKLEVSNSQDFFEYKNVSSSDSNSSIEIKKQNSTVVHTTSSPFKVTTMLESIQVETTAALNTLGHKGSGIKKSLGDNSSAIFTPSSSDQNCTTPNMIPNVSGSNDTLKKILSVVLKIKYDIENLTHNQNRIDKMLSDVLTNERSVQEDSVTVNYENDYSVMLPLHNEDALIEFENKLVNKSFRLNVVNGLKRLVKNSLASTIKQMVRTIFDDELLQNYSYVGQKKKKIFSSLASCAIIFETVRSMKLFQDVPNSSIETPIKIYIAGAAFRKKKN